MRPFFASLAVMGMLGASCGAQERHRVPDLSIRILSTTVADQ